LTATRLEKWDTRINGPEVNGGAIRYIMIWLIIYRVNHEPIPEATKASKISDFSNSELAGSPRTTLKLT